MTREDQLRADIDATDTSLVETMKRVTEMGLGSFGHDLNELLGYVSGLLQRIKRELASPAPSSSETDRLIAQFVNDEGNTTLMQAFQPEVLHLLIRFNKYLRAAKGK